MTMAVSFSNPVTIGFRRVIANRVGSKRSEAQLERFRDHR